jgi:hypothetical protein
MRFLVSAFLITFLTISGCKIQEKVIFGSQDIVKEKEDQKSEVGFETIELENALGDSKWEHINKTKLINIYRIDSVLVSEKYNEYGRKLEKLNTISQDNVNPFLASIKDNNNYAVSSKDKTEFNPSYLFEFCAEECELSLLFDSNNNKLGFINLDGPKIVYLSKNLTEYLNKTINKKD